MNDITAEQLHNWYLEAIEQVRPDSYNPNAVRPFKDLSLKQQAIDEYIARQVNVFMYKNCECKFIREHEENITTCGVCGLKYCAECLEKDECPHCKNKHDFN